MSIFFAFQDIAHFIEFYFKGNGLMYSLLLFCMFLSLFVTGHSGMQIHTTYHADIRGKNRKTEQISTRKIQRNGKTMRRNTLYTQVTKL
jgi:hypothetical protein